jgi:outer membrane lipopolysaccharide assembly protein LptE/RlpB
MSGRRRAWLGRAALVVALALATGCGYGLVGRTSSLPEDIQEVFVQPLANRTNRTQVDQLLTLAISDEFVKRRRFKLVNSRSDADAVLSGVVTGFGERAVAFGGEGRGTEYEIQITADMEFRRPGAEEPIWVRRNYRFRESYEIDVSAADYFDRADLAIQEVAEKFAETLIIDLLEGF